MLRYERKMKQQKLLQSTSFMSHSAEATISCEKQPDVVLGAPHLTDGTTCDVHERRVGVQQETTKLKNANINMSQEIDAYRR